MQWNVEQICQLVMCNTKYAEGDNFSYIDKASFKSLNKLRSFLRVSNDFLNLF